MSWAPFRAIQANVVIQQNACKHGWNSSTRKMLFCHRRNPPEIAGAGSAGEGNMDAEISSTSLSAELPISRCYYPQWIPYHWKRCGLERRMQPASKVDEPTVEEPSPVLKGIQKKKIYHHTSTHYTDGAYRSSSWFFKPLTSKTLPARQGHWFVGWSRAQNESDSESWFKSDWSCWLKLNQKLPSTREEDFEKAAYRDQTRKYKESQHVTDQWALRVISEKRLNTSLNKRLVILLHLKEKEQSQWSIWFLTESFKIFHQDDAVQKNCHSTQSRVVIANRPPKFPLSDQLKEDRTV